MKLTNMFSVYPVYPDKIILPLHKHDTTFGAYTEEALWRRLCHHINWQRMSEK